MLVVGFHLQIKHSSFLKCKWRIDLINNITVCILDKPLVLHSNPVCNPCFRRVELLGIEETVLKSLNE